MGKYAVAALDGAGADASATESNSAAPAIPTAKAPNPRIAIANQMHGSGKLDAAETLYREILQADPDNPNALHGLGLIAYQTEHFEQAVELLQAAVRHKPDYVQAYNNLGNALNLIGRPDEAREAYEQAVLLSPQHAEALNNLANLLRVSGQRRQAIETFERALEADPEFRLARMNMAKTLIELGRFDEAQEILHGALEACPDDAEIYFNIGLAHSLDLEFEKAVEALSDCVERDPRHTEAYFKLGYAHARCDRRLDAQVSYRLALEMDPDHTAARNNLGNIFASLGRYGEAVVEYERALKAVPRRVDVIDNLGVALRKAGRFEEAFEVLDRALKIDPHYGSAHNDLGAAYQAIGDIDAAARCYLRAVEVAPDEPSGEKNYLFALLNLPGLSSAEVFRRHCELRGRYHRPGAEPKIFSGRSRDTDRRLRIGYLSSDFRTHVVSLNMLPLFENHDHDQVEIFLYAEVEYPDRVTAQIKSAGDHWRPTKDRTDAEVAEMVEADEIDILVCMAGADPSQFPRLRNQRPRRDGLLADRRPAASAGNAGRIYRGALSPANLLPVRAARRPPSNRFHAGGEKWLRTFGSFNKPEKVNDEVVALWSDVLKAVPDSRLLLKYFNLYREPSLQRRWRERFAAHGIPAERLVLKAQNESRHSHLQLYNQVDIALGPFPFNGATTTFEALTMGVPVVAVRGRHFVDRVAASIATHAGHPEFVAGSEPEYVERAVALASDIDGLNEIRARLRADIAASPICDGRAYAVSIENAYRDMWGRWCRGDVPAAAE